eukprot:9290021-Ditylum_brightwellii.AAC.1
MHTENFKSSTSKTHESNKLEFLQGGAMKKRDKGNGSDKPWMNDYSAWVPFLEFNKLSKEEKNKWLKARAEAKRARKAQARQ